MQDLTPERLTATLIVIFFAIGLHEYAHCKVADMAGDPTPGIYGRVTLNLIKHFDPVGTVMIIITSLSGYGLGWGKPAPMDASKMANPRWDFFAAVAAGPLSNFFQAVLFALVIRSVGPLQEGSFLFWLLIMGVLINLYLCFFNLVPLGPLDGHWLIGQLLPEGPRLRYYRFNATAGSILLIGLVLFSQFDQNSPFNPFIVIEVPVFALFRILTGLPFGPH